MTPFFTIHSSTVPARGVPLEPPLVQFLHDARERLLPQLLAHLVVLPAKPQGQPLTRAIHSSPFQLRSLVLESERDCVAGPGRRKR